jgi:NitT/TauT family transport system substrate-binding protein
VNCARATGISNSAADAPRRITRKLRREVKMRNFGKIAMISVALLITMMLTIAESASNLRTIRLGVMVDSVDSYIPIVGEELGIYKKYGLDVKAQTFSVGINTVDALTLGQLDLGMAADFAALNRIGSTEKSNLRIYTKVATSLPNSQSFYVKDDSIKSPKDLANKSIIVHKGTVGEYWIALLLEQNGVAPESVKLLPTGSAQEDIALLRTGQAVGTWAGGQAGVNIKAIEGVKILADLGTIKAPTLTLLMSTKQYLDGNKETVANYLRAVDEILRYMLENPEKAAEIVHKKLNVPTEQALLNITRDELSLAFTQDTMNTLDSINKWARGANFIKTTFDARDYVNVDALREAFPDRVSYK